MQTQYGVAFLFLKGLPRRAGMHAYGNKIVDGIKVARTGNETLFWQQNKGFAFRANIGD